MTLDPRLPGASPGLPLLCRRSTPGTPGDLCRLEGGLLRIGVGGQGSAAFVTWGVSSLPGSVVWACDHPREGPETQSHVHHTWTVYTGRHTCHLSVFTTGLCRNWCHPHPTGGSQGSNRLAPDPGSKGSGWGRNPGLADSVARTLSVRDVVLGIHRAGEYTQGPGEDGDGQPSLLHTKV